MAAGMTAEVAPEISFEAGNADKLSLTDTSRNSLPAVGFHRARNGPLGMSAPAFI